jgi:predicted glycosyltransferase
MKILFDIYHLPQVNLFKHSIRTLKTDEVIITTVNRGKLVKVLEFEFPENEIIVLGDYQKNKGFFSMLFKIIIPRLFKLSKVIKKDNVKLVFSSSYQSNVVAKLKGIPNYIFTDDYRVFHPVIKYFTTKLYMPSFIKPQKKIISFKALKEWAYLSPTYFKADQNVLKDYSLVEKEYVFIREVSTESLNYLHQLKNIVAKIAPSIDSNINVLFSLENKNERELYPANWIPLKEPIKDIHSLMYYSKCVISSGDSMAREGAMLGVKSMYLGERDMPANTMLMDEGLLKRANVDTFKSKFEEIVNSNNVHEEQSNFREHLNKKWIDVTSLILSVIKKYK